MPFTLYHRTRLEIAQKIIAEGFRDGEGTYMTTQIWSGVWVSAVPLDENEGACGNALLRIELAKEEHEIREFEWIEEGKGYREWLIPAALLNEFGKIEIQEIDEEFLGAEVLSSDPNALQNAEAEKGNRAAHARAIDNAAERVRDSLDPFTGSERRLIMHKAQALLKRKPWQTESPS